MAVVTISREFGSGGDQVARRVCDLLGYRYFDKTLMAEVALAQGISDSEVVDFSEDSYRVRGFIDALLRRSQTVATASVTVVASGGEAVRTVRAVDEEIAAALVAATVRSLKTRDRVVVVGRGGQAILRDAPGVLHARIVGILEDRIQRLMQMEGLTRGSALGLIEERDQATAQYLRRFHAIDWADPALYHLTINAWKLGAEAAAEVIVGEARRLGARQGGK